MGNPSPRLLTRMLEDSKRKQEEKVANADLFARLNYFGQSSDQIRARARATTAVSATSSISSQDSRYLPKDLDELRQLIRGTSQEQSLSPDHKSLPRNSQILKPSQIVELSDETKSSVDASPTLRRYVSSKVPSMDIITEDCDEEEEGDEDIFDIPEKEEFVEGDEDGDNTILEVDERTRQESIRKFVQARFSGRDSGFTLSRTMTPSFDTPSNSFSSKDDHKVVAAQTPPPPPPVTVASTANSQYSPSIAPRHRASKRVSMQCVHPKLLEKICEEWMESVPWKVEPYPCRLSSPQVPVFICNERTIATSKKS